MDDLTKHLPANWSGLAMVAAYAIPQLIGVRWTLRFKGLDHNVMPRDSISKAETTKALSPADLAYVKRRNAAHYNGLENLAFFLGPLCLANIAELPVADINYFCAFYIVTRFVYTVLYVIISNENLAAVRTIVWWTAMLSCLRMALRAGSAL